MDHHYSDYLWIFAKYGRAGYSQGRPVLMRWCLCSSVDARPPAESPVRPVGIVEQPCQTPTAQVPK